MAKQNCQIKPAGSNQIVQCGTHLVHFIMQKLIKPFFYTTFPMYLHSLSHKCAIKICNKGGNEHEHERELNKNNSWLFSILCHDHTELEIQQKKMI